MILFAELKRRNVIRMAGLYLVGAWLVVQVAETILPAFDVPNWVMRAIVIVLALGLLPALAFSWVFELTPDGFKRDEDVGPGSSIGPLTGQRMNRLIILLLALAVLYFGFDKFVLAPQHDDALAARSSEQAINKVAASEPIAVANRKSIAVLPFENLSSDKDNAYFATGMQDEILTRLAAIHDLKVISRTSTEQYASHPPNLKVVAEQLGVATVLEGSVQRANGKVRINLQLIDARDDSHLWAHNYDRDLKDVFAVQSDVAEKVAEALQAQLLPAEAARIAEVPTQDQQAHDLFLQARYLSNQLNVSTVQDLVAGGKTATDLYRRAIAADPDFALAYAQLSYLQSMLFWYGIDRRPEVVEAAREAVERALQLQPGLPEAHLAMGYVHYWGHRDYDAALREFAIARASLPNSADVIAAIAYVKRRQGGLAPSVPEFEKASVLDPRNSLFPREIAASNVGLRRYAAADAAYAKSLAITPGAAEALVQRAGARIYSGDLVAAERMLAAIPQDLDPQASVTLLRFQLAMLQRRPDQALAVIEHAPQWLLTRWEHSAAPLALLRGQALAMKGEAAQARGAFQQARQLLQDKLNNPAAAVDALGYLGLAHAGLGDKQAALEAAHAAVDKLPMSRDAVVGAFQLERLARVEAQVGEADAAIEHLQQLMDAPTGETVSVSTLRIDPAWDPLRKDLRFRKLISDAQQAQDKIEQ